MASYITFIITILSTCGFGWFGYLAHKAGQQSGTGYIGEFIFNGGLAIICALLAIGFGIWTYKM